jgi:diphosphomevalonate decarboxylase
MKATAVAPSNIAFIKYWGKKDEVLRLPENGSISMNLSDMTTTTTVEFDPSLKEDSIVINDTKEANEGNRAIMHLDRIRERAEITDKAKVVTITNFPRGTGLSSSASGFAALTVAASKAVGLTLSEKELSILARQGSGSACRSIPNGITEWLDGETSDTSYAVSLYPPEYWDLCDVVAVVSVGRKEVATSAGMKLAQKSPFFKTRRLHIKEKIILCKKFLAEKNFPAFGELIEAEALELHAIMLTSTPSLIYWTPGTLRIMKLCKVWRSEGIPVYFTINTGQDIHLICEKPMVESLKKKLTEVEEVKNIIVNTSAPGAHLTNEHLF